jgi:hypothetical protein
VKIEVPTYDRTLPWVPTLRVPAAGFRGTAYATDSAKWNGGGKPGRGDPAVMRVYGLNAPQFDGSAAMVTAFTAVADDLLGLFGELAYEVQIEIKGVLDTQWAGLGRTLKLVDTTGARDFSFLDDVTLSVVAVEWDVENTLTRVFAGTKASGRFNLDALRRALMAKHRAERQKTAAQRLEALMACLSSHGQQIGQDAPTPVCAEHVVMQRPSGGGKSTNLKIEIEIIFDILEILFDLLEFQKGGEFSVDPDTGDVTFTDEGGTPSRRTSFPRARSNSMTGRTSCRPRTWPAAPRRATQTTSSPVARCSTTRARAPCRPGGHPIRCPWGCSRRRPAMSGSRRSDHERRRAQAHGP